MTRHIEELGESAGLSSHAIRSLLDHASARDATRLWKQLKSAMLRQTAAAPGIGKSTECVADASARRRSEAAPTTARAAYPRRCPKTFKTQAEAAHYIYTSEPSISRFLQEKGVLPVVVVSGDRGKKSGFDAARMKDLFDLWTKRADTWEGRLLFERRLRDLTEELAQLHAPTPGSGGAAPGSSPATGGR